MNGLVMSERIEKRILFLRGQRVMLSADLAELYEVAPKVLVQAVKRNSRRFPCDFMFQLNLQEVRSLRSQIGVGSIYSVDGLAVAGDLWPQPDESRCPQEQGPWAGRRTAASKQIANDPSHGLDRVRCGGKAQGRVSLIRSVMADTVQEFADDRLHAPGPAIGLSQSL
mgnify:CR=1 FL=1